MRIARTFFALGAFVLLAPLLWGCDTVPPPDPVNRPTVSDLEVTPSHVQISDLPADQVGDSLAQVNVEIAADARDSDGQVERVVFAVEPASSPRGTATGRLASRNSIRYERQIGLGVPIVDEVYTVRVFAVDNDSLASNQVIGRVRIDAD